MKYLDTINTLHTRGVAFSREDYLFALMVASGEDIEVAYAIVFDHQEFNRVVGTEDEQIYLTSKRQTALALLEQQNIKMLKDTFDEEHRAIVQKQALNLKDFKFSGEQTVQILNNLLKSRIDDIDSASVKDVVGIIKSLTDQGALEVGDGGFSRHFVQIFPKFNALCIECGKEFDAMRGLSVKCPHCGQVYTWMQDEQKYIPQPTKL